MTTLARVVASQRDSYPWPDPASLIAQVMERLGVGASVPLLADRLNWNSYGWSDNDLNRYRAGIVAPSYEKLMAILFHAGLLDIDGTPPLPGP